MGVMQHRRRQAAARVPEGGGLTAQSLTDTATDDDIMQGYTGEGSDGTMLGAVDLDYDDVYDLQATGHEQPPPNPYTPQEARADSAEFGERPFHHAQLSRDVAQTWGSGSVTFDSTADPILIAGADPKRKRIVIKNASFVAAVLTADINVGSDASVPKVLGSGGTFVRGGNSTAGIFGDEIEITSTGEVWVVQCVDPSVAPVRCLVTWYSERYA